MRFPIEDGPPSARSFGPADDGGGRDAGRAREEKNQGQETNLGRFDREAEPRCAAPEIGPQRDY